MAQKLQKTTQGNANRISRGDETEHAKIADSAHDAKKNRRGEENNSETQDSSTKKSHEKNMPTTETNHENSQQNEKDR